MSGKLQIAISGLQNEFISGNPTFSHFLSAFKKHTKFAFNVNEFPLVNAKLGEETQCIIPVDSGDLISTLTLRWKMYFKSSISSTSTSFVQPFHNNIGIHGIDYAELYIGGQLIERITGDWIYLYHLFNTADYIFSDSILYQTQAVRTNPYNTYYRLPGTDSVFDAASGSHIWTLQPMHIDLPFYFYKNLSASILACKLNKQNCYVKIKFKSRDEIIPSYMRANVIDTNIESASILTKYTFLDDDELNYLKSRPIKQLITQTQLQKYKIPYEPFPQAPPGTQLPPSVYKRNFEIPLTLHNPIKIVHFFITYSPVDGIASGLPRTHEFKSAGIKFNGNFLFDDSYAKSVYDNRIKNSVSSTIGGYGTARIGSYSFALYPTSNEPSGHLNLNRIIDKTFVIDPGWIEGVLNIYGTCYNMIVYSDGLCGLKY
ncbi:MAG: hypothetical protein CL881_08100 [Dehalococcoidia bacterium]|nr:hypothetical protein [Dehalococcoidia bacterium]|tara:strand:- start:105 stop:1391 length:1287 start_codon:yes stop_codon:yes gene_type:complete